MTKKLGALVLLFCCTLVAAVPVPKDHLGFAPGDDYKLADYGQIIGYFQKLQASSDRIRLIEFGKSSEGRPMYLALISAPENLKRLDQYRSISRRLALGQAEPAEARRLAAEGKAIVWIDSGLHSTEVAPAQHAPELAWQMVSGETPEIRRIRQNVILLQIPVINPDGHEMVVSWYRRNVGTQHELASLPWLYQKYAGHDNNRDWFMMNLEETRHVTRLLYHEWFPQIVYNQHQQPAFPARIFVPPYAEPLNPNIPAPLMEGVNLIGSAMKERLAREDKPGVLSYFGFDGWWNGGLRTTPMFHNMHGILTETAAAGYASPRTYGAAGFPERFSNGIPTREPSIFYQRPWLGGKWTLRDAVDYILSTDFAILDLAASRSEHFLLKAWEMAQASIEAGRKGKPFAYVVPAEQWDASSAHEMLKRLAQGGVEIHRAGAPFQAGGKSYPAGSWVLPAGQAFRAYLVDLMEPQKYPEIRTGVSGPTKRPYDIAGWTLSMQMGVTVDRVEDPFQAKLEPVSEIAIPPPSLNRRENSSFLATADLLSRGVRVRWASDGRILAEGKASPAEFAKGAWELSSPRVGLYEPPMANMDTGWTQWLLDAYRVPYSPAIRDDLRKGGLRARFDTIILASQSASAILRGILEGAAPGSTSAEALEQARKSVQRPEFAGGIGSQGAANLEEFVRQGGTLIAFDAASDLVLQSFPVPVRGLLRGGAESASSFYCPGSLLRVTVDDTHPIAFGMPKEAVAVFTGGQAFETTVLPEFNKGDREVRPIVRYAKSNLLASGWVSGERAVLGRAAMVEARLGQGSVVLFGFRPQFRGQPHGTFKLLLNAVYLGSAKRLP